MATVYSVVLQSTNYKVIMATVIETVIHPNIKPTKCALRYKPPVLIVFYSNLTTGKKRRRSMPLRNFTSRTDVAEYATSLYNHSSHKQYISSVKREQLESLLERVRKAQDDSSSLLTHLAGDLTLDESITVQPLLRQLLPPVGLASNETKVAKLLDIDDELERILGGGNLPDDDIDETKNTDTAASLPNNKSFIANSIQVRHSLPPLAPITGSKPINVFPSALDDNKLHLQKQDTKLHVDNDADYSLSKEPLSELEEEIDELSDTVSGDDTPLMTSDHLKLIDMTKMISSDDEAGEDYNKMPESEYQRKKAEMNKQFELQCKKPTDSDFVYDKQEDYGKATMESGWDSSSSGSEF